MAPNVEQIRRVDTSFIRRLIVKEQLAHRGLLSVEVGYNVTAKKLAKT